MTDSRCNSSWNDERYGYPKYAFKDNLNKPDKIVEEYRVIEEKLDKIWQVIDGNAKTPSVSHMINIKMVYPQTRGEKLPHPLR